MIADVITRLKARVTDLQSRVEGAAQLAEMARTNRLPQASPAAFVIPTGIRGGEVDSVTSLYTQMIQEGIAVVLVIRSHDPTGRRILDRVDSFIHEVITAIAGWAPGDEVGEFQFRRGQTVSFREGTLTYQIDFEIADQLRITS